MLTDYHVNKEDLWQALQIEGAGGEVLNDVKSFNEQGAHVL